MAKHRLEDKVLALKKRQARITPSDLKTADNVRASRLRIPGYISGNGLYNQKR